MTHRDEAPGVTRSRPSLMRRARRRYGRYGKSHQVKPYQETDDGRVVTNRPSQASELELDNGTTIRIADVNVRVVARIIDGAVVGAMAFIVMLPFVYIIVELTFTMFSSVDPVDSERARGLAIVWLSIWILMGVCEPFFSSITGQTLGKRCAKIRVVSIHTGDVPSTWSCFRRWLFPLGSDILVIVMLLMTLMHVPSELLVTVTSLYLLWTYLGIGGASPGWLMAHLSSMLDAHGRGLHDKIASTIVVDVQHPHEPGADAGTPPPTP